MPTNDPIIHDTRPEPPGVLPRLRGRALAKVLFTVGVMIVGFFLWVWSVGSPPARLAQTPDAQAAQAAADLQTATEDLKKFQERMARDAATVAPPVAAPPEQVERTGRTGSGRTSGGSGRAGTPDPQPPVRAYEYQTPAAGGPGFLSRRAVLGDTSTGKAEADRSLEPLLAAYRDAGEARGRQTGLTPSKETNATPAASQAAGRVIPGPAEGEHRVFEGRWLPAVLLNRLDSGSDGPIVVMTTEPTYASDRTLVIPVGSRVIGKTSRVDGFGEERMAVTFHRLIFPNGASVDLDQFVGANMAGDIGLKDKVNRHLASTLGVTAAIGLIQGLAQYIGSGFGATDTSIVINSGADSVSQGTTQVLSRMLNRPPTVTIREGHRVIVYVANDLTLPAYQGEIP